MSSLFSACYDKTVKQYDLDSHRCIRTFQGHSSYVYCLASTVNGDRLLSGDYHGSVLLWDVATGQQLASIDAHPSRVSCLAVTPDGNSFVSGSFGLKLWRFEALQQPVLEFSGHIGRVHACVVSTDGFRLYSVSCEDSIRVWDITTGQQLATLQSHTDQVTSLALSGSMLVSGSKDKTVKLWDTGSLQLLNTLQGNSTSVRSVAAISDGSVRVFFCGGSEGYAGDLRLWNVASGALLARQQAHSNEVRGITVSSDSCLAALASEVGTHLRVGCELPQSPCDTSVRQLRKCSALSLSCKTYFLLRFISRFDFQL